MECLIPFLWRKSLNSRLTNVGPLSVTSLLPIMLKNLPIILFYYSAANWYYSKKTRPLFQQFCKVFTHYSSNFPDQHIHSKETSKFMHYIVT